MANDQLKQLKPLNSGNKQTKWCIIKT